MDVQESVDKELESAQESTCSSKNGSSQSTSSKVGLYEYLTTQLVPAAISSLPLLLRQLVEDPKSWIVAVVHQVIVFILPKWSNEHPNTLPSMRELLEVASNTLSPSEFLLRNFDTNDDGHISSAELLNMTEILKQNMIFVPRAPESWATWFRREWPLMDWKIGVFLWRSFGGILLLLAVLSIVPGRLHGISGKTLRWPILGLTYFLIGVELMVYIVIRLFIRIAEYSIARPKHRKLRRLMQQSISYPEWYAYAAALDKSQGRDRWLRQDVDDRTSSRYNWAFIRELIKDLTRARATGDSLLALAVLQQCTRKNVGGVMSEDLFAYSNTGEPKTIVKEFIGEVVSSLHWLSSEASKVSLNEAAPTKSHSPAIPSFAIMSPQIEQKQVYEEMLQQTVREEKEKLWKALTTSTLTQFNGVDPSLFPDTIKKAKGIESRSVFHRIEVLSFLKRARAAYGRTALCLSGGAMMGLYHFGHVLGLLEAGVLPDIISGTSGGSVIAAVICTRTDDEIRRDFDPQVLITKLKCFSRPWPERIRSVWQTGNLFTFEDWIEKIQWFTCGQTTFAEAYQKTGRTFCVTLSSTTKKAPPVLLNHLTTPNITVASAVIASAAVPGFVPPVRLQYKDANGIVQSQVGETYFDGSIEQDIPVNGLAEMFNCQFFIACQCNPHIVPFFFNCKGGVGRPSRWSSGTQEDSWRGGFLLAALELYLKNDMRAKFRFLHELEAAIGFTSSMMVQDFVGSTTIVPQVAFLDYFKLVSDPNLVDLYRYFQAGCVASYEHLEMISLHYSLVDAVDECISLLEGKERRQKVRPRSQILMPASKNCDATFSNGKFDAASLSTSSSIDNSEAEVHDTNSHATGIDSLDRGMLRFNVRQY